MFFKNRQKAAAATEMGLLLGLIGVAIIAAVTGTGTEINKLMGDVSGELNDVSERASNGGAGAGGGNAGGNDQNPTGCAGATTVTSNYCIYADPGTHSFTPPTGVGTVRFLVVGGGAGGHRGHADGSGSGFAGHNSIGVSGTTPITVGAGGPGVPTGSGSFSAANYGGQSCFGTACFSGSNGANGGSGGGGYCNTGSVITAATGGSAGSNGNFGCHSNRGSGQGTAIWANMAANLNRATFTFGAGGAGGRSTNPGGGGGGGWLINGSGPSAGDGVGGSVSARGGQGYGAGAGAGSYNEGTYYGGGDGAPGVVYVEWD